MLQAAQVAARLGGVPYVINLAACRHHFAVGFASALKVGAITLLPPNRQPGTIVQVAGLYPGCVALCDQPLNAELLEELCKAGVPLLDITESGQGLLESATDLSSIAADQCAAIVFTSGSTGEPAAVAKPWGALTGAADLIARRFFSSHAGAVVATVPPQHMYGLETTVVMGLCGGASICATQPFFPADVQAALAAVPAPRTLVTTPVHLRALLRADLSVPQLRQVISATAPLQADQAAEAEARWDCRVMEIYGCSEAGSLASRRTVEGDFWELLDGIRLVQGGATGNSCRHGRRDRPGIPAAAFARSGEHRAQRGRQGASRTAVGHVAAHQRRWRLNVGVGDYRPFAREATGGTPGAPGVCRALSG